MKQKFKVTFKIPGMKDLWVLGEYSSKVAARKAIEKMDVPSHKIFKITTVSAKKPQKRKRVARAAKKAQQWARRYSPGRGQGDIVPW